MKYFEFNINNKVRVKLTEEGHRILKRNHDRFWRLLEPKQGYDPPVEDKNGFSDWQMWELMREFGPDLYNGCKVPFETTIFISEEHLDD